MFFPARKSRSVPKTIVPRTLKITLYFFNVSFTKDPLVIMRYKILSTIINPKTNAPIIPEEFVNLPKIAEKL